MYGEATLTNVTVASSETFLALTLVLVWLCVGAGPAVLAGLVSATIVQIWSHKKSIIKVGFCVLAQNNREIKFKGINR